MPLITWQGPPPFPPTPYRARVPGWRNPEEQRDAHKGTITNSQVHTALGKPPAQSVNPADTGCAQGLLDLGTHPPTMP